jgi:hypothetical protein
MKQRLRGLIQAPPPVRPSNNELVGIYYNYTPDPGEDSLSFHCFRRHAAFRYPIFYFHPASHPPTSTFVEQFGVEAIPLEENCFRSLISYSEFMTSLRFYELLEARCPQASWYLLFQRDSFLITPGLEKLMRLPYDYYGAPWEKGLIDGAWSDPIRPEEDVRDISLHGRLKPLRVGNGGFSLRRILPCREVCARFRLDDLTYMQEDVFYCNFGQLTGMRFAPIELARRFSWEDAPAVEYYIQKLGITKPLGFHNLPVEMAEILLTEALAKE